MEKFFESSVLSCFPVASEEVPAGFPSPAENHSGGSLDLTAHLIKHPEATFFLRVRGDSMTGAGIFDGDLLIVDRSLPPVSGDIVIAVLDGEFTVKRLIIRNGTIELRPENPLFKPLRIYEESQLEIWGVVTAAVKSFR
ncbi:MAG: translesion error-prone DNA polymerase V autoproteolytic subunit [Planctomycetaceae bacterium]|jgi:DNA polymerase V|nr:translesion error-prone DNA polymerase V autoproteolytic subunit [Planctomycetaceae bacterium]